jgi:hypothetical protein
MRTYTELDVINAPLPIETATYKPVANGVLIEQVKEKLYKNNLQIVLERYDMNPSQTQLFTTYQIAQGGDGQRLMLGFRNSYDKSLAVGFVAGTSVIVCSNLMLKGDIKILRKHTTNVFRDLDQLFTHTIDISYEELESNIKIAKNLKQIPMSRAEMGAEAGRMFINEGLINSTQLNIMKREINESPLFKGETAWDFYNHTTEGLKASQPGDKPQAHINASRYLLSKFN